MVVGPARGDQRDVGLQRHLDEKLAVRQHQRLLAFGRQGAHAGRRQHAAEPEGAGADAFGERALRHQLDLDAPLEHRALHRGMGADVARDDLRHQAGIDQPADAEAGPRGVVADQGEVAALLAHQLVDQAMRAADAHEAADHHARAIGRDAGHGLGRRDGSLLHGRLASTGRRAAGRIRSPPARRR